MKLRSSLKKAALAILLLGLSAGCGAGKPGTTISGGNPAAPPAPPSEVPAALQFPSDLGVDVETISSTGPSSGSPAALVGSGGQFSEEIAFAADLTPILTRLVNDFLQPLPQLLIPANTETTTFETVFESSEGARTEIKIDFADFDGQGCSGHTAALPVCFRIWFDGQRRMAGLFNKFPTPDNSGAGSYRMTVINPDPEEPGVDVAVIYDHSDPLDKFTEIFEKASFSDGSVSPSFHIRVSQEGPDTTARKSLLLSANDIPESFASDVIGQPASFQYVGQWREDNDFWSGSVDPQNIDLQNFSDVCALISTGNPSNPDFPPGSEDNRLNCIDLSIDVGGIPPLDFLTPEDVALSPDFSESPTF